MIKYYFTCFKNWIYLFSVKGVGHIHAVEHMWSRDELWGFILFWNAGLGMERRWSGLVASPFTCCHISLALTWLLLDPTKTSEVYHMIFDSLF